MTTSAWAVASRAVGAVVPTHGSRQRCRPIGVPIVDDDRRVGEDAGEHLGMTPALDPGADDGHALSPRAEPADHDAGHGRRALGGDRAAVQHGHRLARRRVAQDDDGVDRRDPVGAVRRDPGDPFHAQQVVGRGRGRSGRSEGGRHGVGERALGPGMHADLRGQLGVGDERGHRPLRQLQPRIERGHGGDDLRATQVQDAGPHRRGVYGRAACEARAVVVGRRRPLTRRRARPSGRRRDRRHPRSRPTGGSAPDPPPAASRRPTGGSSRPAPR